MRRSFSPTFSSVQRWPHAPFTRRFWLFNEGSGLTLNETQRLQVATQETGVGWGHGLLDMPSVAFDGSGKLTMPDATDTTSGSWAFWFRTSTPTSNMTILGKSSSFNGWAVWLGRNGNFAQGTSGDAKLRFAFDGGGFRLIADTIAVPANKDTFVCVTWGANGMKLYRDGLLVASNVTTATHSNATAWTFGADPINGTFPDKYTGLITLPVMSLGQLSPTEVMDLYVNPSAMVQQGTRMPLFKGIDGISIGFDPRGQVRRRIRPYLTFRI